MSASPTPLTSDKLSIIREAVANTCDTCYDPDRKKFYNFCIHCSKSNKNFDLEAFNKRYGTAHTDRESVAQSCNAETHAQISLQFNKDTEPGSENCDAFCPNCGEYIL